MTRTVPPSPAPCPVAARPGRCAVLRPVSESGFTIVEVLVAALVLTIGIVAVFGTFQSSQRLGTSAETHQTAAALGEGELERIRALSWTSLGLTARPTQTSTTDKNDPTYYEQPAGEKCTSQGPTSTNCYRWNWEGEASTAEPLVIAGGADSTEDPQTITTTAVAGGKATRLTFKIYRFITWATDGSCTVAACSGEKDTKRVLVAVTGTDLNRPLVFITLISDRELGEKDALKGLKCESTSGTEVECVNQS